MRRTLVLALPAAILLACSQETPPPSTPPSPASAGAPAVAPSLAVGALAPDFTATASDGTHIQLAALKGKPVVVYFYPQDETPGCTKEACSFRDAWSSLSSKGVVLIGISADSDESHRAFAKSHQLPFLLVSDPKGEIAKKFGVPLTEGATARQSFVIAADGNLKQIYRKVDVTVHAAQIAADVQ